MPKMKTSRAAAKRFKVTGTGKLKRNKAYKRHILTKKTTKTKRNLRKATMIARIPVLKKSFKINVRRSNSGILTLTPVLKETILLCNLNNRIILRR